MAKKALVVWGGWDGHEPKQVGEAFTEGLRAHGFEVEVANTLDAYRDGEKLKALDLIVPVWTMGKIEREQEKPLLEAVKSGVGIGGCHGGMCDSFRQNTEYQFMTGGQWVAHPGGGGVKYMVNITDRAHFITKGLDDFEVTSEQYYLHVDPANRVLATTTFPTVDGPHAPNGKVKMPVVWTKFYGKGRVFYTSLGHVAGVVAQKEVRHIWVRGLLWAAHGEELLLPTD
jgi:hypothetical protein